MKVHCINNSKSSFKPHIISGGLSVVVANKLVSMQYARMMNMLYVIIRLIQFYFM